MKKIIFWLLATLISSGAFAQITTTTNVGRIPVAHPDLGHVGGATLHTKVATMWGAVSNHIDSRYYEFTLANGATTDLTHNFQTPFADIGYIVYSWNTGTGELTVLTSSTTPTAAQIPVTAGPDTTDQVTVTNSSGSSRNLAILITQQKIKYTITSLDDVNISSPTNRQFLVYDSGTSKWLNLSLSGVANTASVGIGINDLNDVIITAAANGDIVYYNGTDWVDSTLASLSNSASIGIGQTDLNDTLIAAPSSNQLLRYNGTNWENISAATVANTASTGIGQTDLNDTVITSAANGDLLRHDGTNWKDDTISNLADAATIGLPLDKLNDVNAPSPDDGQALVWSDTNNDWRPGASGDASFKIQDVAHPNAIIKGGTMQGKDRRQFRTWDGGGSDETDFGTDLTCDLTAINPTPTNAAIYYIYIDLPGAQNGSTVITQSKQRVYPITCADIGLAGTNFSSPEGPEGLEFDSVPAAGFQREFIGWVRTADSGNTYSGTNSRFGTLAFRQLAQPEYNNPEGRSYNFLRNMNFNFEHSSNGDTSVMGWTATGLAITVTNSGNEKLQGTMGLKVNSSATDQTLTIGTSEAQQPAFLGKNCLIRFNYKFDGGDISDYKVTVLDNATELFTPVGITPTSVSSAAAPVFQAGFTCPAAPTGELTFQIKSDGNNGDLFIDQVYLGLDDRIGTQNDGAELIAAIEVICTGSTFTRSSSSFGTMGTATSCTSTNMANTSPSVTVSAPTGTDSLDFDFTNLPPGRYATTVTARVFGSVDNGDYRIATFDGTNTLGIAHMRLNTTDDEQWLVSEAAFTYTTTANKTFSIHGAASTGTVSVATTALTPLVFKIYRFPTQSPRETLSLETQGNTQFSGTIYGADADLGTAAAGAATVANSGWTLDTDPGSGTVEITCASGTAPSGANCGGVNEVLGIAFTPAQPGVYEVCFTSTWHAEDFNVISDDVQQRFWLDETSLTSLTALGLQNYVAVERIEYSSSENVDKLEVYETGIRFCDKFNFTSATKRSIRLFEETIAANGLNANKLTLASVANSMGARFEVKNLSQNFTQAIALTPPNSQIKVDTPNGYGSTNTAIRRFGASPIISAGQCITYADSATLGGSFTINCPGTYCATWIDRRSGGNGMIGLSVNSVALTSDIQSINATHRMGSFEIGTNLTSPITACGVLAVGDVVRAHGRAINQNDCTSAFCEFNITHTGY